MDQELEYDQETTLRTISAQIRGAEIDDPEAVALIEAADWTDYYPEVEPDPPCRVRVEPMDGEAIVPEGTTFYYTGGLVDAATEGGWASVSEAMVEIG